MDEKKSKDFFWASSWAAFDGNLANVKELAKDPAVNLNWQDNDGFTSFNNACGNGKTEVVRFLLGLDGLNPNLPTQWGSTPFSKACEYGHVDVVSLLLGDDRIEANKPTDGGFTPFFIACENGHVDVVSLLLGVNRIDVNQLDNDDCTPLWAASQNGHLSVVQHLLASGREIDTRKISTFNNTTAAEQARLQGGKAEKDEWETDEDVERRRANCPKIAALIDAYESDPEGVIRQLRRELGFDVRLAGELFALVVYLSDGYLTIRPENQGQRAQRFFFIATQLPMDLQMVLCNRVFGIAHSIVKNIDSERGFRKFAKGFR